MTENSFDTIIIGSGLGGLLCGHILSREGMKVCILEKQKRPGGATQSFTRKGVEFNTGMHYIGSMAEGEILNRYFRYFGLTGKLNLRRLNPDGFDIIGFDDGEYSLAQGFDNFMDRLLLFFPDQKNALRIYTDKLKEVGKAFPLFNLEVPAGELKEHQYRSLSAYRFYQELTAGNQRLSAVLAGNNLLYAGNREKTPLHIPALINHSFISSAWKIEGGSSRIADLLIRSIEGSGGKLITGSAVNHVGVSSAGFRVSCDSGETYMSRQLVSGVHPAKTLKWFDPSLFRKAFSSRITNLPDTTGAFTIYAVLKENSFPGLDHNYYFHRSHDVWHQPGRRWPEGYLLYTSGCGEKDTFAKSLVIISYMDYSAVSAWADSVTGKREKSYYEFKERMADKLLEFVGKRFQGIRSSISLMETSTPLTWRDYTGTPYGSMYGIAKDFNDPEGTTVFPATKVPGLFFTGQNINLHGMIGVTTGAVMTCSEILGYEYLIKKIRNG